MIPLTPRERAVLKGVAAGYTDAQIARQQSLTVPQAVHTVLQMRLKLDARNRAHLVALAVSRGLLTIKWEES